LEYAAEIARFESVIVDWGRRPARETPIRTDIRCC
jgi:hypothetical protein